MNRPVTEKGDMHFTVSVYLISDETIPRILLIFHKKLNQWMQPGGHIERKENTITALLHESLEETGIKLDKYLPMIKKYKNGALDLPVPLYLQQQPIPIHENEPAHYHLDMGYVFKVSYQEPRPAEGESEKIRWFTKTEALGLETSESVKEAIIKAFDDLSAKPG